MPAAAVSLNMTDSHSWIAVEGPNHTLHIHYQQFGSATWTDQDVSASGQAYSTPSMTNAGGLPVIAVQGPHHSLDFYWSDNNGWHREQVAGEGSAYSAPAMSEGNSTYQIAVEGPSNSLDFYWQTFDTAAWNENVVDGSGSTYSQPAMANWECSQLLTCPDAGGTDIYAEGPSHSMIGWSETWGGSWSGALGLGTNTTYSAPALQEVGDDILYDIHLAWEGPNHSLDFLWQDSDTNRGRETIAGAGTTYSAPGISTSNGALAVSAQGQHNTLKFYWQDNDASSWNIESVAGSGTTYGPPSVGEGNNSTDISAPGPSDSLDFYWQTYGGGNWNPEVASGSGSTIK